MAVAAPPGAGRGVGPPGRVDQQPPVPLRPREGVGGRRGGTGEGTRPVPGRRPEGGPVVGPSASPIPFPRPAPEVGDRPGPCGGGPWRARRARPPGWPFPHWSSESTGSGGGDRARSSDASSSVAVFCPSPALEKTVDRPREPLLEISHPVCAGLSADLRFSSIALCVYPLPAPHRLAPVAVS